MSSPHLAKWTEANGLVFISGQLPFDGARRIVGETIDPQTKQALENLDAVLREAGLGRKEVLKTTVWLRDAADFAGFNDAYAAFFGDHRPARSTVVATLVASGARVEIEAVAARRS